MSNQIRMISTENERLNALTCILGEFSKAEMKHPDFPVDLIHRSAIVAEESGELVQACLDNVFDGKPIEYAITEAAQVGATVIRFLVSVQRTQNKAKLEAMVQHFKRELKLK